MDAREEGLHCYNNILAENDKRFYLHMNKNKSEQEKMLEQSRTKYKQNCPDCSRAIRQNLLQLLLHYHFQVQKKLWQA